MSRVPKWKIEKAKVKVVFRLQFHATNIPSTGWDKLFLSFISADTGKVTAKTNKANVRNGSCKWPDPIYEATRLLQDSRTKTYDDKLYKLVVAMGTSRSSILGEVDVNLAEFAEAVKPVSIALPFRGCDFGTVLHVTAQLLSTKTGFREFEQQRETGARSSQQLVNQRSHDPSEVAAASSDIGSDKNGYKESESSLENHPTVNNTIKDISKEHKKLANDLNLFQKELERLKSENSSPLVPLDINLIDPSLSGLGRALSQLDMANEHLRSIFPSFQELPGSGNALERVLALELELAEALQAKKKTDILFQSSFLKQHNNDESAVFQSFRDINELIQDTIELKRKQAAVESELQDMQGRYSELSLQLAEVEGERQKLAMTLKTRSPRKQ